MASSSSSSSSSSRKSFEVFLSFRGEDTRHGFTAHLYDALCRRGINTFIDDEDLKRGQVISPALVQAIENSMFSIVVLSENYASSRWCLEELVKILECMNAGSLTVFPIFYKVDPSDVRKQRRSFGEAFVEHEKNSKERVKTWREALTQVANLSGWDSRNRHEPSFINEVVSDVFNRLLAIASSDAGDLVGIDSHIRKMESLLSAGSNDVRIIGIWGMGGIGKTTIARAVYEQISKQFEACCFLSNVREDSEKHGLVQLQKELLSQLLEEGKISISTVDIGLAFIKTRLCFKRVLIVLDDAHNLQQLEYLAGKHDWFGPGSRIIITTRDVHLLNKVGVNGVYEVVNLNNNDAVTLFSRHAFKKDHPTEDYMELSNYAVSYAKGLPLALKVLGSFLFSKSKLEWKSQLDKLKMNPCMDIGSVLRVSFDGLDDTEQDIFLDVACFFRGEDKDYVIKILDSCGFYPDIGIRVLIDKALITVVNNKLWMHDLLQEMGWDIVRKTSHKNPSKRRRLDPGKRSRLWLQEDVYDVLTEKTGTENIEGIFLNLHGLKEVHYTTEAFAEMKKLRLLKVYNSHNSEGFECASRKENYKKPFSQDFEFPSNKLRYLYWHRCPLKSLPSNFHPKNLVELNLCYCYVEELWKGVKHMEKLEFIDLSHSPYLVRTPDFSGIPNLERLILEGCTDLREVHQSLGVLSKLIFLNLKDCKNLQHFPSSIELESLKVLILSGCSKLDKFPEILGYMPNLLELHLNGTAITELPSSIGYATRLVSLDMENCKRFKTLPCCICKLKSLKILKLSGCAKFESFPEILENMEGLRELFLDGTAVKELPLSVEHLNGLVLLNLRNCERLITLPSSICSLKSLSTLTLSGCSQLEKLPENLGNLECLVKLEADGTAITQPPSSIILLRNLEVLSFQGCNGSPSGLWNSRFWSMLCLRKSSDSTGFRLPPLSGLCSLKQLNLSDCNIKEGALPNDLGGYLSSLEDLNLKGNDFVTLPTGISKLCNLRALYLRCCKRLQELPMLPPNINRIDAQNCTSLETLSGISAPCWLAFTNSFKQNWGQRTYLAEVSRIPKFNTYLPGNGIPEWFSNQCMGDSINIQLPSHWYNDNFLGFAMCIVFMLKEPNQCRRGAMLCELESSDLEPSILGCFLDHIVWEGHSNGDGFVESDHLWLGYHPNFLIKKDDMDWPNKLSHIKASFVITGIPHEVKWCGFRLVYMEDLNDNNSKITKCSPVPKKSSVVLQDLDDSARKDTIIHDEYYNDDGGPSGSLCSNKDLLTCHEAKPKKSSVVLQDLDESATKDTIIHDEGGPSGSLCSNKDLLTCHEAKPEERKTLVRKLLECFCIIWIDLLHSRNGSTSMDSNYEKTQFPKM